jgi:hypothetical protein
MFTRNPEPEEFTDLLAKFKSAEDVCGLVRAQMIAGAKFALIWIRICHSKINLDEVVSRVLLKCSKRRINIDRYIEMVQGPAEEIVDKLLQLDSDFFRGS